MYILLKYTILTLKKIYLHVYRYDACPESKDTSRVGRYGNCNAYYGNTAVDLDPLPVSRARLTGRTGFV